MHAHRLSLTSKEEIMRRLVQRAAKNTREEICTAVVQMLHKTQTVSVLPTNKLMETVTVLQCPVSDNQVPEEQVWLSANLPKPRRLFMNTTSTCRVDVNVSAIALN